MKQARRIPLFLALLAGLCVLFIANLSVGSVSIPFADVVQSLIGDGASKDTWDYIIVNYRLPKAITAVLAGMGLSVSGLLMQTLFKNPLAGPYVLGISSGSSLGVALLILGSAFLPVTISELVISSYGIVLFSCIGSLIVLLAVLAVSERMRDTASILIIGLMFSSFTGAIVGVLTYFSTAEQLQKFTFWSMGNLGNMAWSSVLLLTIVTAIGMLLSFFGLKPLDALLLGDAYAESLGVNLKAIRRLLILATALLAGCITAFAGPIAFVGMAVPHIAKLTFRTGNHHILFGATVLYGAAVLLICDMASNLPGTDVILPINAITSIIGAPVVIWLLLRKRKLV